MHIPWIATSTSSATPITWQQNSSVGTTGSGVVILVWKIVIVIQDQVSVLFFISSTANHLLW